MLPIGTQILVAMSTANKKLSPRCGSIGYVSGVGPTKFLTDNYENGLVATPISIIFTKYGNAYRLRRERRTILNIIPIEIHNLKQNAEENIETLKKNFKKRFAFFKKQAETAGAVCAGTIIPNNLFHNIVKSKRVEVESWVQSYIEHYYFNKMLPNALKQLNYSQEFVSQLLIDYSKLDLQDIIPAIRAASTIYSVRNYDNYLIAFEQTLTKSAASKHMAYNMFFDMYVKDFFDKEKSILKEVMVKKYAVRRSHVITASNMNKMSAALIKLNHSKGA